MKNPVKLRHTINNSDLNLVGESLDYDWNTICDEIGKHGLHGEDGCGYVSVRKYTLDVLKKYYGDMLADILYKIFEMNPEMNELYINDDF